MVLVLDDVVKKSLRFIMAHSIAPGYPGFGTGVSKDGYERCGSYSPVLFCAMFEFAGRF